MVFKESKDYLCYIEAVALMYEENTLQHCSFTNNPKVFMKSQFEFNKNFHRFLNEQHRSKEYFIVIDNTEWPEALDDRNWSGPKKYSEDDASTIFLEMNITTTFTSALRHGAMVSLFSVVIMCEVILFVVVGVTYIQKQHQLNEVLLIKKKKMALKSAVKESEYELILKKEERRLSEPKYRGINSSITADENGEW